LNGQPFRSRVFDVDPNANGTFANTDPAKAPDGVAGFNVHSIALAIPLDKLAPKGKEAAFSAAVAAGKPGNATLFGVWASASRPLVRLFCPVCAPDRNDGIYNDGPWGWERSIYPFAPVSLGSGLGLALAYDVASGPQDVRFFHSTYTGESFTALVRLGIAAEPQRFTREARFRLSLYRVDGSESFRSALDRYMRLSPGTFENRMPRIGGWMPWEDPSSVPGVTENGAPSSSACSSVCGV
jgi:hypothetical protein